jgi:hypothetical protein
VLPSHAACNCVSWTPRLVLPSSHTPTALALHHRRATGRLKEAFNLPDEPSRMSGVKAEEAQVGASQGGGKRRPASGRLAGGVRLTITEPGCHMFATGLLTGSADEA